MNKSDFNINCPHCNSLLDLYYDYWKDELLDDSDSTEILCNHCSKWFKVKTNATYTFEIKEDD